MTTVRSKASAALNEFHSALKRVAGDASRVLGLDARVTDKRTCDFFQQSVAQLIAADVKLQAAVTEGKLSSAKQTVM